MLSYCFFVSFEQTCHLVSTKPHGIFTHSHLQPNGFIRLIHHNLTLAGFYVLHNAKFNSYTIVATKLVQRYD